MTSEPSTTIETKPSQRAARQAAAAAAPTKSVIVIKLLSRTRGATPHELTAATDWQPHSVRAFLSGLRKQGRTIVREARKSGEFAYRIGTASGGPAALATPTIEPVES